MSKSLILISLVSLGLIVAAGCASNIKKEGGTDASAGGGHGGGPIFQADNDKAAALLDAGINAVDVREINEYTGGHIPGVKLIPLQSVPAASSAWQKDEPVLLVCRSGNRSMQAADFLRQQGFTKIYNLTRGMSGWTGNIVTGPAEGAWPKR